MIEQTVVSRPAPARTGWTSWHLHLGSPAQSLHDRVLTEVVTPVVRALGKPWFFIRYWQGGPHLRLRIADLGAGEAHRIEDGLRAALAVAGRLDGVEEPLDESAYRDNATRFARTETGADSTVADFHAPGVYRSVYEPEYERYGGAALMPRTERLFQLSSELVLGLVPHLEKPGARTLMALRGTVSAAAALGDRDEQAAYYTNSVTAWRAWAADFGLTADAIERLCAIDPATTGSVDADRHGPFAGWHAALVELVAELPPTPARASVVFSHTHMLHNRLGRSLFDELRTYAWLAAVFPRGTGR